MTAIMIRYNRRFANDATGCLEIPLEIRQQLGITIAQSLSLEIVNGCIILQPIADESPEIASEARPTENSFLAAAGELIGCLENLPPDLSHNKQYLGKE